MHQAHLYSENNDFQVSDATYVLKNYFHFIKWKTGGGDNVLDIGCGDGRVTADVLYPLLPNNIGKLVGADISPEMIEFAKVNHNKKNLSYIRLDLGTKQLDEELMEEFDHIFSFYCVNWVQDQRQCVSNFYDLLNPGGDMLLMFLAKDVLSAINRNLSKQKMWMEYMTEYEKLTLYPYYHSNDAAQEFRSLLSQVGFKIHYCKVIDRIYTFESIFAWKKFTKAYSPFLKGMTDDLKENYVNDMLHEMRKLDHTLFVKNNDEETVQMRHKVLVVYASKPLKY